MVKYHMSLFTAGKKKNQDDSFCPTAENYTPGSHTIAQCISQEHMEVDGHLGCGRDQTCDLFYDRTICLTTGPPCNAQTTTGYFNEVPPSAAAAATPCFPYRQQFPWKVQSEQWMHHANVQVWLHWSTALSHRIELDDMFNSTSLTQPTSTAPPLFCCC